MSEERRHMQQELEFIKRNSDSRLDRIESKIDQLSDAMVSLARAEEKLIQIEKTNQIIYDRLNRHGEKIDYLEMKSEENANTIKILGKGIWALLAAVLVAIGNRIADFI